VASSGVATLSFGVLGPLHVSRAGGTLALGGRQQRAVLAMLLLEADTVVSVDRLRDAIWGEHPTPGSVGTVQTYVHHLREVLEPDRARGAAGEVLVTVPGGYRLRVSAESVDAGVFERRVRTGHALLGAGRFADASVELAAAVKMWRGPVLADLSPPRHSRRR
jgi:DNA-binding SARP family transcriptional activator